MGHEARVLEPSPPASVDPEWYADDPTDPTGARGSVVTPIAGEGILWQTIVDKFPELGGYASGHWLTSPTRLPPLPARFAATRDSLHRVAFFALAPKRYAATGKLGLRYTHGGFGTPFFGHDEQVRVEGRELIHQTRDGVASTVLSTLGQACDFLGIPYRDSWYEGFRDPLVPSGPTVPLVVDEKVAAAIGDWFGFATLVLERLRRLPGAEDVSRVQLWPEHFDVAIEIGSADNGHRASYGASLGDSHHPEPYFYVAPGSEQDPDDLYWNAPSFKGASLSYGELLSVANPAAAALAFLERGHAMLAAPSSPRI